MLLEIRALGIVKGKTLPTILHPRKGNIHHTRFLPSNAGMNMAASFGFLQTSMG
jgi:hypothetical protein